MEFSKILLIRQAIGQAVLQSKERQTDTYRQWTVQNLLIVLQKLLPETPVNRIEEFVEKVVDKAITLKDAMTEEQAVYRCFFVAYGTNFDESIIQIAHGEETNGKVLMCTFPGLGRLIIQDQKKMFITVVKACAKLEAVSRSWDDGRGEECEENVEERVQDESEAPSGE